MKFSVSSKVTKFKPSKKTVFIVAGSVLILALLVVSVAAYQVSQKNEAEADKKAQADNTALITGLQKQVTDEQEKTKAVSDDKTVLCTYLAGLEKAPATKGRLTRPTLAHCPQ